MKKSIARLWVQALMSGEYKQTTGRLHKGDCFCSLGVLCDLYLKDQKLEWVQEENDAYSIYGRRGMLPVEVMRWAGVQSDDGSYSGVGAQNRNLTRDNDTGKSFQQIANIILDNIGRL